MFFNETNLKTELNKKRKRIKRIKKIKQKKVSEYSSNFKPVLTVFTGAGISQESDIKTFRDKGGLWETYKVEDVATIHAFNANPDYVISFFNQLRDQVRASLPNGAHDILFELEKYYEVNIITQNVDDLHEKAGSKNVIHLHGQIMSARSSSNPKIKYELGDKNIGHDERCPKTNSKLRPDVVFFGERIENYIEARMAVNRSDIFMIIGTSLEVYPAADLTDEASMDIDKFVINPVNDSDTSKGGFEFLEMKAGDGLKSIKESLIEKSIKLKNNYLKLNLK
jgi:NAD-dependent deacetylase